MSALDKLIWAVEAGTFPADVTAAECGLNGVGIMQLYAAFNGSLDAALALHEALLPGCGWKTQKLLCNDYYTADVWGEYAYSEASGTAPTPARAWLIAVLKAYREITQ